MPNNTAEDVASAPASPAASVSASASAEPTAKVNDTANTVSSEEPSGSAGPVVDFEKLDDATRLTITLEESSPVRWGFRDGRLYVLVMSSEPYAFTDRGLPEDANQIAQVGAGSRDDMQILTLDLACECGAVERDASGTHLVMDIREGADRPVLELAHAETGGSTFVTVQAGVAATPVGPHMRHRVFQSGSTVREKSRGQS